MNWTREQLKTNAKQMIKKNYWLCVAVAFVYCLLNLGYQRRNFSSSSGDSTYENLMQGDYSEIISRYLPTVGIALLLIGLAVLLIRIFVTYAVSVGTSRFFLHNIESKGELGDLGYGFQNDFMHIVGTHFLRDVYIFLFTLLLIIPGIIKRYEYYLVSYIMADNPELSADEVLQLSKDMMDGEKMNVFVLNLSFILWEFLSALTLNLVGILWVNPYKLATDAELYIAIKERYYGAPAYESY